MKSKILGLLIIIILSGCKKTEKEQILPNNNFSFYVGTYTDGDSKGIYKYTLSHEGELHKIGLATVSDHPSFLAKSDDNKYLLAVNEISNTDSIGTISSFKIEGDSLIFINKSSSGGAHPCHITINQKGYVLTSNYTGGNIGLHKLDTMGRLSNLLFVQQHSGSGITGRQKVPHAHSAWFTNDNVIAVDLGTNELWISKLDTTKEELIPLTENKLKMAQGAGPRHLTFHPNNQWIYVVNELNGTVTQIIKTRDNKYTIGNSVSTLPDNFSESNSCADIHIASDGKFLYASNRGHNSIVIYSVNEEDGALTQIGFESVRGNWPRNFTFSPDEKFLLVANQYSNNIISFKRDLQTGKLIFVDEINAPTPVCILF